MIDFVDCEKIISSIINNNAFLESSVIFNVYRLVVSEIKNIESFVEDFMGSNMEKIRKVGKELMIKMKDIVMF
jgi:Glu-tRNA(Gln) amidotransferase subunit E-like FAD-binding protein